LKGGWRDGMVGIVVFHLLMLFLGLGIISRTAPVKLISDMLGYLHGTIGITTPPTEQVRTIALVWIGATVVTVDGCLVLLVVIAKSLH
jgi:hypothetical protein